MIMRHIPGKPARAVLWLACSPRFCATHLKGHFAPYYVVFERAGGMAPICICLQSSGWAHFCLATFSGSFTA